MDNLMNNGVLRFFYHYNYNYMEALLIDYKKIA